MKKALFGIMFAFMMLISVQSPTSQLGNISASSPNFTTQNMNIASDYSGNLTFTVQKTVRMNIENSYTNSTHESTYIAEEKSGWTLSKIVFSINDMNASYEYWASNQTGTEYLGFKIEETDAGDIYDGLRSNITPWAYDWNLVSVSINQFLATYSTSNYGVCYYAILNSTGDFSDNITNYEPISENTTAGGIWVNYGFEGLILSKGSDYYFAYNGTKLNDVSGYFPNILWYAVNLGQNTNQVAQKHYRNGNSWYPPIIYEPKINVSFIYWNDTTNLPIVFDNPASVSMQINGLNATHKTVIDNPSTNVFRFNTNSSVVFDMNVTLYYTKSISESHTWYLNNSQVTWNMTFTSAIPANSHDSFIIMEYPSSWVVTGLYNQSTNENYTNYILLSSPNRVNVTNVGNTTWVLVATAPDYVSQIRTFDGAELTESISIENVLTIDVYVNDSTSGISVGTVWLSITKDSILYYNATAIPDFTGIAEFNWDIDQNTSLYGYYEIHANWTDGDRAGFQESKIFVYHPTSLTTDNNLTIYYPDVKWLYINATFMDTFANQDINDSEAALEYSIDLGAHNPMSYSGTKWIANISLDIGHHLITIYANGFGYENRTKSFYINVYYRTHIDYQIVSSLAYSETTLLKVNYTMYNGSAITNTNGGQVQANITGSWVNLLYNASSKLWVATVYGWQYDLGNISIAINGTGTYFESRSTIAHVLIIDANTTKQYNPPSITIYYTEHAVFEYRYMAENGTVIADATVNITLGGSVYPLRFNETTGNYTIQLNGTSVMYSAFTVSAWRYGFKSQVDSITYNVVNIPTGIESKYPDSYLGDTPFKIYLNMTNLLNSTYVSGFIITAYVNGSVVGSFVDHNNGSYTVNIMIRGFGRYNLTIYSHKYGFASQIEQQFINVIPLNASLDVVLQNQGQIMSGDTIYLRINVTNTYNSSFVSGFNFDIYNNSSIYSCNVTDYNNGTYLVSFVFHVTKNMTVNLNVTGFMPGFNNVTSPLSFNMWLYKGSSEIITYTNIVDYGDLINITVRWLYNNSPIEGANCILNVSSSFIYTNGLYNITINSTQFISNRDYTILITLYHIDYESEHLLISVHINAIDTVLDFDNNLSVVMNHTLAIRVTFYSKWNNSPIYGLIETNWSVYNIQLLSNRTYLILLSTNLIRPDSYVVRITAANPEFISRTVYCFITVLPRTYSISGSFYITDFENETIDLSYTVIDSETHNAIPNLNVILGLENADITYNIIGSSVQIHVFINTSGIYHGNISFYAYGYANITNTIVFVIKEKVSTSISISGPDTIVEGGYLVVDATLRRLNDSAPIRFELVQFIFKVYTEDNSVLTIIKQSETNSNGFTQGAIRINESLSRIEVYAQYIGNKYYWSCRSSALSIEVTTAPSIIDRVVQVVQTPLGSLLMVAVIFGIISSAVYTKIILPKRLAKRMELEEKLFYFTNLAQQEHVLIILDTGVPIFSYSFGEGLKTDETLIAGLLTAINSVASEIRDDTSMRLKSIDYEGMKVFVFNKEIEGHTVSFVLIGNVSPIDELLNKFEEFTNAFGEQYADAIRDFVGDLDTIPPEEVQKLLEKYLDTYLLKEFYVRKDVKIEGKYKKIAASLPSVFTISWVLKKSDDPAQMFADLVEMIKLGYIEPV